MAGADVVGVVGVLLYGDARGFYGKYIIFSGTFVVVVVDVFCFHLLFATLRIVYLKRILTILYTVFAILYISIQDQTKVSY